MKCLFINLDRGAGVSLIGELFLDIIKRFGGINSIDVYTTQCINQSKEFINYEYDIAIINDYSPHAMTYKNIFANNKFKYILNISHGTLSQIPDWMTGSIDLNYEYVINPNHKARNINKIFPLHFVPGNIWENKDKPRINDRFVYAGRISNDKLPCDVLQKLNCNIDVYGFITDQKYYETIKHLINYCGEADHKRLVDVYNCYRYSILFSNTECLSISLREQIMCGTTPLIIDKQGYSKSINQYVINYDVDNFGKNRLPINLNLNTYVFDFNKMILNFLLILRGITLCNLTFKKNNIKEVNHLHKRRTGNLDYSYDIVNWNF